MSAIHLYRSEMILWGGTGQAKVLNPISEHFGSCAVAAFNDFPVQAGLAPVTVVHPTAWVAPDAVLGKGAQVMAKAKPDGPIERAPYYTPHCTVLICKPHRPSHSERCL